MHVTQVASNNTARQSPAEKQPPSPLRQQQDSSQFMEHAYTSAWAPDLLLGAASYSLRRPALGCDHSSFWNQTVHVYPQN